jgi:hypothetical protein
MALIDQIRRVAWALILAASCLSSALALAPTASAISSAADEAAWMSLRQAVGLSISQQAKLVAADGADNDQFGYSVALSGGTALVGAPLADVDGWPERGAAYVFVRSSDGWIQQAKLVPPDGPGVGRFGSSVAISGDTALVGAPSYGSGINHGQGAAYVFVRSGTAWTLQSLLTAADGAGADIFGYSIALDGQTALIGAPGVDTLPITNRGAAYLFERHGTTWVQQAKLLASDGTFSDRFGWSVALSGDTSLVGAIGDDIGIHTDQGSAYAFVRDGDTWRQQAKLQAQDGASFDQFGRAVALSGTTALIGAPYAWVGGNRYQGAGYVFAWGGGSWAPEAKLVASDGQPDDMLGLSVALWGNAAVIGAPGRRAGGAIRAGSAFLFARTGVRWDPLGELSAAEGAANDLFGLASAISGDTVIAGAQYERIGQNFTQGAAYVYSGLAARVPEPVPIPAVDPRALWLLLLGVTLGGLIALRRS